jgi:predicted alpha/beta superfamily hydrolase
MRSLLAPLNVLVFFSMLAAGPAVAEPLLPPHADGLYSNVLRQQRAIEVYLPEESAKNPPARYETLYVLDGDWNAKIVVDIVDFMRRVGFLPPIIVVSVPNHFDADGTNSRDHDLTPTSSPDQARSGGAAAFLAFLKTELIPYVEAHYPANGIRSIHGHSYGGLFLFYVLTNDPSLFCGYIVLDPAMGWDKHMFDAIVEAKLPSIPGKGKAFYVATRTGQAYEGMGMAGLKPVFERRAPADLHWNITSYPNETHDSLKLKGTYDALQFVFDGYTQGTIAFVPSGGTLIRGKPLSLHMQNVNERLDIRYTTDASEPNGSSPRFGEVIPIDDAAKTRIKLVSHRGLFDRDLPHHLANGVALRPSTHSTAKGDAQWHFELHTLDAWPNLRREKPLGRADVEHTRNLPPPDRDAFATSAARDLVVNEDGYYVFYVESSDKARLTVAGKRIADVDGTADRRMQAIVEPLQRGTYALRLEARHPKKDTQINFEVFRDSGDAEWWKHRVIGLSDDDRR